jgi:hypothetical protein
MTKIDTRNLPLKKSMNKRRIHTITVWYCYSSLRMVCKLGCEFDAYVVRLYIPVERPIVGDINVSFLSLVIFQWFSLGILPLYTA